MELTRPMSSVQASSSHGSPLQAAFDALSRAEWRLACTLFRDLTSADPSSAEAWAGLAAAAYWVPDEDTILEARERAYHLYRERGNSSRAAEMAAWLAVDW